VDGLELKVDRNGTKALIAVTGEIDLTSAPRLDDEITNLIDGSATAVVIDLAGVSFMDSTGLRVLLKASKLLASAGGMLEIKNPSEPVQRLLEVSGLNTHFSVADDA
jgi:anti-sigma B factor antagonist